MKKLILFPLALALLGLASNIRAYGPEGHTIIGAIADARLANTVTSQKVSALIDGYTLREVSLIPDTIKQWDKSGINDPQVQDYFSSHPKIARQLREFWLANPPYDDNSETPSHHWFHYTDISVAEPILRYRTGKVGRGQWDIVQAMRYCIGVLKGSKPEDNPRKITKPMAVILLAHLVGDIHQPLHVGVEYFDRGQPVDPDRVRDALDDEGGNNIRLHLKGSSTQRTSRHLKLHGFWDDDAVWANLPEAAEWLPKEQRQMQKQTAEGALINQLSTNEPRAWSMPASMRPEDCPEVWADEILPIAREAHSRLRFSHIRPKMIHDKLEAEGDAFERVMPDHISYREWSRQVERQEMQKAGWRLADLLTKLLGG